MISADTVIDFFSELEGEYKWYVLGGILIILTALMTRVIFKTLKWFLLVAAIGVLLVVGLSYLGIFDVVTFIGG